MNKNFLLLGFIGAFIYFGYAQDSPPRNTENRVVHQTAHSNPTAVYQWLEILLEASGRDVDRYNARPTILSRTMAVVLTAMYDAWAAYDTKAVGTRLGGALRRPAVEHTQANKEKAIAYAAYYSLLFVYEDDKEWIQQQMKKMGYDPSVDSADITTPEGVGSVAAQAVIDYRRNDGANQFGNEVGSNGKPYSDFTLYRPKNTPDQIVDPTTWFPIPFNNGKGGVFFPGFLTPHWYRVKPFAFERGDQFRPPAPPLYGSKQLEKEVMECIEVNANLTIEQKAIVEFMRDGPRSTGQSGHWLRFAQDVSRRDQYNLDQDIKLFFSVANIVLDTFISCWDAKRYYDTGRPYWWVRIYHKGKKLRGWLGPGKGFGMVPAEEWVPYSPDIFVTPPFPGYPSGHATASGGAAKILELFTGSDTFNAVAKRNCCELTEAGFPPEVVQAQDGVPMKEANSLDVELPLPTFSGTAEMAAISRLWGGYHIRTDNEVGLALGRKIAEYSWPKYQSYFNGTATH